MIPLFARLLPAVIGLALAAVPDATALAPLPRPSPLTLLSSPSKATASSGDPRQALDGDPQTAWTPKTGTNEWLAVRLQEPAPHTLVIAWLANGYRYEHRFTAPQRYSLQTSADSTDGRNGTWRTIRQITDNQVRTRADVIATPGARWVRLWIHASWARPALRELAIYGSSSQPSLNQWFMAGDSITDAAFNTLPPADFLAAFPPSRRAWLPLVIDGATGGATAETGMPKLQRGLSLSPPGGFVALAFGTNDCRLRVPLPRFQAQMQALIDAVRRSGRLPILARIPWNPDPGLLDYVTTIDALAKSNGLPAGPDLYRWFQAHPNELEADRVHPNAVGRRSVQRLWGDAAVRLYPQSLNGGELR